MPVSELPSRSRFTSSHPCLVGLVLTRAICMHRFQRNLLTHQLSSRTTSPRMLPSHTRTSALSSSSTLLACIPCFPGFLSLPLHRPPAAGFDRFVLHNEHDVERKRCVAGCCLTRLLCERRRRHDLSPPLCCRQGVCSANPHARRLACGGDHVQTKACSFPSVCRSYTTLVTFHRLRPAASGQPAKPCRGSASRRRRSP